MEISTVAVALGLVTLSLGPHETTYDRGRFTLDIANDDFGSDVDEAFTSGIQAIFRFTPDPRYALSSLWDGLADRLVREYWGFLLGHEIYTPALLQETDLDVLQNDRRYAGWVYGGLLAEFAVAHSPFTKGGYSFYRAQVLFGSTGPRTQTAALQRYWHAFIRDVLERRRLPEDPKGWSVYQVPDHWGVIFSAHQEAEVFRWAGGDRGLERDLGSDWGFRIASLAGGRVGNMYVDAEFGATMRTGLMPRVVFDDLIFFTPTDAGEPTIPFAIYGFVTGRLIVSAYNALLDGPPGSSGPNPDRNHVMARLEAGMAIRLAGVELMFRHTTLSPDLVNRPPGGVWIQNWGRFTLSFDFY